MDRKSLSGEVLPEHSQFCVWVLTTPDPSSGKRLRNDATINSPARNSCQSHRTVHELPVLTRVRQLKPEVHPIRTDDCILSLYLAVLATLGLEAASITAYTEYRITVKWRETSIG